MGQNNAEFIIRTEDIKSDNLLDIYVETGLDRENINYLKSKSPVLLVGSRGTGKTMLLRIAEKEMDDEFRDRKVLPVMVSFSKAIFVDTSKDIMFFRQWMLSKILFALKRKLSKKGVVLTKDETEIFNRYFEFKHDDEDLGTKLEKLTLLLEQSWNLKDDDLLNKISSIFGVNTKTVGILNEVDYFKAIIEDICSECGIERIVFLFDEVCHNFIPLQQRHFFTLFRDIRSPYITCKAAVYPGITSFGTFQTFHDAIVKKVERDITSVDYIDKMREIVKNQVEERIYKIFEVNGDCFNALIYAASGNPRLLLKSLYLASNNLTNLKKSNVESTLKEFYRTHIWNEHSKLAETYDGHKKLNDWGRWFIESIVLMDTYKKNGTWIEKKQKRQTLYFAIHRDVPEVVKQAIKILEYSGIVSIHTEGTKVRKEIFDRYQINFGVVLATESQNSLLQRYKEIINNLSIKLYTDYGMNSPSFGNTEELTNFDYNNVNVHEVLKNILEKCVDELDITEFQKTTLKNTGIYKLKDVLNGENELQKAYLIGPIRSRRIFNIALNATIEYVSG